VAGLEGEDGGGRAGLGSWVGGGRGGFLHGDVQILMCSYIGRVSPLRFACGGARDHNHFSVPSHRIHAKALPGLGHSLDRKGAVVSLWRSLRHGQAHGVLLPALRTYGQQAELVVCCYAGFPGVFLLSNAVRRL